MRWVLLAGILFTKTNAAQFAVPVPKAPEALKPSAGQAVLLSLTGKGSQIYVCQNASGSYSWKLQGPDAKLYGDSDEVVGRHFAGPTWEANDGSRITGKLLASVPSPDPNSIPWLLLIAITHNDVKGIMTPIKSIQRLNTKGGTPPARSCEAANKDEKFASPYEADYYFYGEPLPGQHAR